MKTKLKRIEALGNLLNLKRNQRIEEYLSKLSSSTGSS